MLVKDLVQLGGETIYRVVDATVRGFMTSPWYLHYGADRNVIGKEFGDKEVVAFEVTKRDEMTLYVK